LGKLLVVGRLVECRLEHPQVLVADDAAGILLGSREGGGRPAQGISPE
jgi:hypothetical protein